MKRDAASLGEGGIFGEAPARLDSRMVFTPDHRVLYLSMPKTGCSTIKVVIAGASGLLPDHVDPREGWPNVHVAWRTRPGNWSSLAVGERDAMLGSADVFRFTSVRNPFERAVSCYLNKVVKKGGPNVLGRTMRALGVETMLGFLEAVATQRPLARDVHCRAMTALVRPDRIRFDQIIRYESFETDLRAVMTRLGVADGVIPKARWSNRTRAGSHLAELLGPREQDLVREIYREDFEAFGYPLCLPSD